MKKQIINYQIKLNEIKKIALNGIERAIKFSRFVVTSSSSLGAFNNFKDETIVQLSVTPDLRPENFKAWYDEYQNWVFCNSINEIIESFYVFLEFIVVAIQLKDKEFAIKAGDDLDKIIRTKVYKVREDFKFYNKIKKFFDEKHLNIILDKEHTIIRSFSGVRNITTHNRGFINERKELIIKNGEVVLEWYRPEFFIKLDSGEEIDISTKDRSKDGYICLRPKGIKKKRFKIDSQMQFDFLEVREIGWTFKLIVDSVYKKAKDVLLTSA
jgi:hypothetical protein